MPRDCEASLADATRAIRPRLVAVTASAMATDREAAVRAGFDGFLEKPINARALPAQVASFLTGQS